MSRKYAILGETLKHTMSPPIHARLFELKNREYEYEILEVKPEELKDKAEYLNSLNGYNITIPHKIGIIDYTDELDQSAILRSKQNTTAKVVSCSKFLQENVSSRQS